MIVLIIINDDHLFNNDKDLHLNQLLIISIVECNGVDVFRPAYFFCPNTRGRIFIDVDFSE